jgi:hypothetical protein
MVPLDGASKNYTPVLFSTPQIRRTSPDGRNDLEQFAAVCWVVPAPLAGIADTRPLHAISGALNYEHSAGLRATGR